MLNSLLTRVFGSRNERLLRQLQRSVSKINALEAEMQKLSDAELQAKTPEFQQRIQAGESLDKILPEAFAVCREAAKRVLGIPKIPETVPAPLQLLRIGPVCLGSMPVEIFCEIGLDFRKRCPIQPAFLVSHAHDSLGYLPTPRHFALGGYETWLGTNRLEPQASEKFFAALLGMAAEVQN